MITVFTFKSHLFVGEVRSRSFTWEWDVWSSGSTFMSCWTNQTKWKQNIRSNTCRSAVNHHPAHDSSLIDLLTDLLPLLIESSGSSFRVNECKWRGRARSDPELRWTELKMNLNHRDSLQNHTAQGTSKRSNVLIVYHQKITFCEISLPDRWRQALHVFNCRS